MKRQYASHTMWCCRHSLDSHASTKASLRPTFARPQQPWCCCCCSNPLTDSTLSALTESSSGRCLWSKKRLVAFCTMTSLVFTISCSSAKHGDPEMLLLWSRSAVTERPCGAVSPSTASLQMLAPRAPSRYFKPRSSSEIVSPRRHAQALPKRHAQASPNLSNCAPAAERASAPNKVSFGNGSAGKKRAVSAKASQSRGTAFATSSGSARNDATTRN
mmetsp:Transcript_132478/g.369344  ORF Transcript_132478/g.369344 Transcript_132478/m.369344 type:complete len:217 (-) Transcript_132478:25-675(-)